MKTKPDSRLMMMTSLLGRVSAKASIQFEKRTLNGVRFSPKMSIKSCGNEEPKDQEKVNIIANSHRRDTLAAEAVNTPSILQQANFQIEVCTCSILFKKRENTQYVFLTNNIHISIGRCITLDTHKGGGGIATDYLIIAIALTASI